MLNRKRPVLKRRKIFPDDAEVIARDLEFVALERADFVLLDDWTQRPKKVLATARHRDS